MTQPRFDEEEKIPPEVIERVRGDIAAAIAQSLDEALIEYTKKHGHLPWDIRPLPHGCRVCKENRHA